MIFGIKPSLVLGADTFVTVSVMIMLLEDSHFQCDKRISFFNLLMNVGVISNLLSIFIV